MRTLVSLLKATLRGGGGSACWWCCCWVRTPDEEDLEDAPDDRRRRGGKGACGAGTGDDRSTLMLLPMGRLSPLFRLIMAGSLWEFFSRVGLCNFMIEL